MEKRKHSYTQNMTALARIYDSTPKTRSGRILSKTKYTIMIFHCVHKGALTAPGKVLPYEFQCSCCPRSEYTFIILLRSIAVIEDLYIKKNIQK